MSESEEPRGWAPIEPGQRSDAPTSPGPVAPTNGSTSWAPPTGAPGWGPPTGPPPAYGAPPAYGYGAPLRALPKGGDARTGPLPLHPMSVGDILDGAFKLLKANARTIVLIVAAVVVPTQLLSAFAIREQASIGFLNLFRDPTLVEAQGNSGLGGLAGSSVTALLSLLTGPFIAGAVSRVVAASYLGEVIGPGAALRATARRFGSLLAASILVFLVEVLGLAFCIIPGALAFALYTAVTPAVMIEEIGPIKAMRRSWRLMRPRMWAVLGIAILARIIAGLLGNLLGAAPSVAATLLGGSFAWLFIAIGGILSSLVSAPIVAIVATLLYFDARIRNEGLDLQMMARDLERSAAE